MEPAPAIYVFIVSLICSFLCVVFYNRQEQNVMRDVSMSDRKLVLISLDGFRWDYIHGRARTPTFEFLKRKGVHAKKGMEPSFLSNTLPNHITLTTGLHPESHGMLDNMVYDKDWDNIYIPVFYYHNIYNDPRWYADTEPIWVSNQIQRKDGRSGLHMWMGGETPIKGVLPRRFIQHTYDMDEKVKIQHLISWLTDDKEPINLALIYFPEPDALSHVHGPDSIEVTRKIEYIDEAMQYLLDQLESTGLSSVTDVIVLADHGFTTISQDKVILLDSFLEKEWYMIITPMPAASISIFPHQDHFDTVYTRLKQEADDSRLFNVYLAQDIPERFHLKNNKRVPPIFATANLNYSFVTSDEKDSFSINKGNHGYDNVHSQMRPIFMAFGPSFKENVTLDSFRNIDVYPLMCHLLGIKPQPNNGSLDASSEILREDMLYKQSHGISNVF